VTDDAAAVLEGQSLEFLAKRGILVR
jgi:hypothetical protein